MAIHATAIVDPHAELDSSVIVGPYAVIGPHVKIGARPKVDPHGVIEGHTTIGCDNHFYPSSSIGGDPQDKKYANEPTRLEIGDRNTVREFTTINTGTAQDAGVTRVGSDNWIMAYTHIAHDCQVGNHTIFANCAQIAGHVHVGDWVILGGKSGVHQFVHIGAHAMLGASVTLTQDLPPFVLYAGEPAAPHGINAEGLKRRGFSRDAIRGLLRAYKTIYREDKTLDEARLVLQQQIVEDAETAPHLQSILRFLDSATRGLAR